MDGEVSNWKSVLCGVPQGSVLGSILFLVYINDLEEGVTSKILKLADDTKLFRKAKEIGDKQKLQDDIDKLVKWSEKWQMLFNFGKCKCLSDVRKSSFSQRIINVWNKLSTDCIHASGVNNYVQAHNRQVSS